MVFLQPVKYKRFYNTYQFLEAETKLIYVLHLKAFLFQQDNVLLL